ncbi:HlyD family type I secretion periplasmic adaptor subunit [Pseudomonas sp. PDM17]|uniref:HlyD family type I secretion periplasmic adaptor subunit n=1 Tax=Pseudomonas sp. PDM17 TaxID=2769285 RepID=UPI001780BF40|nr:HlyD family type I secretion periplasmic adaptor subunit [Pseudomonas sp. PDM17]MBD9500542.1 HlyD family type I secretion periplasmic adaptor subunit [Pseudomonas sp. PDM17]
MGAKQELLQRYRSAWRHSWRRRKQMESPARLIHEVQFLPAALALQEKPPHPAPRYIQWAILAFCSLALIWACIGEIDVVATATGKIVPSGKTKVIQPVEVAVVKAIHVYDGQRVRAGELLVELDSQITGADVERIKSDLQSARIDSVRAGALLDSIAAGHEPGQVDSALPGVDEARVRSAQTWVQGQFLELQTNSEQMQAGIEQRSAEIEAVKSTIDSLGKTLPIARQLASDYQRLLERNYVAKHAWLEKEQALLDQERELAVQKARLTELNASRREAAERKEGVIAQARRAMLDLQHEADQRIASLEQELLKALQRDRLTRLTSPVDGTVQQLAIHTPGGVVTEAQPLMIIVPSNQPVEVEAFLENKDIGFVHVGQSVEIKVETFSFTKHGVAHARVVDITNDAIEDEKRGLLYGVRMMVEKSDIKNNGREVSLSPGMVVAAEIKTDKRKVIDYFLSPLQRRLDESFSER